MVTDSNVAVHSKSNDRVRSLRVMMNLAIRENSRMVAATIGRQLQEFSADARDREDIADATEAVRDASFDLLTSLHGRGGDVVNARRAALHSIDRLEASLAC